MASTKSPQHYEIRVEGVLDAGWSAWFDGLRISGDASSQMTANSGPIRNQAALHGLLSKFRDLGLPLIAVRRIPPDWHPTRRQRCSNDSPPSQQARTDRCTAQSCTG